MYKKEGMVTFGGWYQRTTLHLTEVYEFLLNGKSRLDLSKQKLKEYHEKLNLKEVERKLDYLEYVKVVTKDGIEIKYYEDGLYILEIESDDIKESTKKLKNYFEKNFKPAIDYIFSLGAPTPKILSNIKDEHPIVISKIDRNHERFKIDKRYGHVYSKTHFKDISVYKTEDYIFILANPTQKQNLHWLIETHIFFREFKDQLHKYLNIHRSIWEEIADIKEKKSIRGKDTYIYRNKLEGYKKTIELIRDRINQMPDYAHTRASLSKHLNFNQPMVILFNYRFEDLFNTLSYIKEIWNMTHEYVNSAIQVLVEISDQVSLSGIGSIQILASIGVVTGIIGYLAEGALPRLSYIGAMYLGVLGVLAFILDFVIKKFNKDKKYELKFVEREKNI